jgi:hypothetical protein
VARRDSVDLGLTPRLMGGDTVEPALLPTI